MALTLLFGQFLTQVCSCGVNAAIIQGTGDVGKINPLKEAMSSTRIVRELMKFDFAINDGTHQLLQLCVCKGKVWSIDANAKEKRWSKKAELYENVLGSFMPKLA